MRLDITRHNLGWTITFFVLLLVFFWGRSFVSVAGVEAIPMEMPLGVWLSRLSSSMPFLVREIVLMLLILWNGMFVTRIVTRNMILIEKTYMSALVYLIVACAGYFSGTQFVAFLVSSLLIWSFDLMIGSFRRTVQFGTVFDSAVLTGISVLIYAPAVVYAALLPFALVIFKKGWREWVVALTGVLLPFAVCSYVYWGMGYGFTDVALLLKQNLQAGIMRGNPFVDYLNPALLIFWGVVAGLTGWALVLFLRKAPTMRTRSYKSYLYFIWVLVFSALLFVSPGRSVADFPLIAIPLAVIVPTCFNGREGWAQNIAYLLLIASAVFCNLFPVF